MLPGISPGMTDMKMSDKDSPSVVSFSLRIDTELKRQFEQFCDDVGISIGNIAFLIGNLYAILSNLNMDLGCV